MLSRFRAFPLALLALAAPACGSTTEPVTAQADDAGAADAAKDEKDGGATDGGDASPVCASKPAPPDVASRAIVRFTLTNGAATDRWVMTSGQLCDPYAVDSLPISLGFSCGCECPRPLSSARFERLKPGASVTLTWDARRLVPYEGSQDCRQWGPGFGCATVTLGAYTPVDPGDHVVTVAYTASAPTAQNGTCRALGDDTFTCDVGGLVTPPSVATMCAPGGATGLQTVQQPFHLPVSGDLTVAIGIP